LRYIAFGSLELRGIFSTALIWSLCCSSWQFRTIF